MWTIRHILVPTDLSDAAAVAIDRAFDLAKKHEAAVTVLNASDAGLRGYYPEGFEADRRTIEKLVDAKAPAGIRVKVTQRDGPAAEAILRAADELGVDLIVMGTRGRSGLGRAVLGSVAETIVRSASIPVLTVRATHERGR